MKSSENLLQKLRKGENLSFKEQIQLTILLSIPAILAQISSVFMEYIDASMVGHLGANESASIGLVSSTIWLLGGLCSAVATGFAVQVAHYVGAGRDDEARQVARQAIFVVAIISLLVTCTGIIISPHLPHWLGGNPEIWHDATCYFAIFTLTIPVLQYYFLSSSMLRCSGNIQLPSMLGVLMCVLDVFFNFLFIFPSRAVTCRFMGIDTEFMIWGAGLGVSGAALGTALSRLVVVVLLFRGAFLRSPHLSLLKDKGSFLPTAGCLSKAFRIGFPVGLERCVMCSAQIMTTTIVAPFGAIALSAHSFGITTEGLCYMPGYGIAEAATTLVGQSIGAGRRFLTKRFAQLTIAVGISIMALMGIVMYYCAPLMMQFMTNEQDIITLGTEILRIEAFAEPMFAASIVSYGIFVGAGNTMIPSCMNLGSIWFIRISLALLLAPSLGLKGVWIAMCIELCIRGFIFLLRLRFGHWIKNI
ncbi:MAG: MATE family efflux transporter [Bacteroidales bacterium]|nr:MATE family efflux transporter [Bacteroidales bacterium]